MTSIFNRLKEALVKSSSKISSGIDTIFYKKKLDNETLTELEELLISSDITYSVASEIINKLRLVKFDKEVSSQIIKEQLAEIINELFTKSNTPFKLHDNKLNIILVCGVNGSGKTTTIGKLASIYHEQGKKVAIAACDTFRAAAVSQIATWAKRANAELITGEESADPASVAYLAIQSCIQNNTDILFIDTAGRLHNHKNLMEELGKIVRVIKKIDDTAPHHSMLVLDATTGQNIYKQVEQFGSIANISSLVVTKLDGTAKAGVVVGVVQKFGLPVHFIGIGEQIEDLRPFDSAAFVNNLVGNDNIS